MYYFIYTHQLLEIARADTHIPTHTHAHTFFLSGILDNRNAVATHGSFALSMC